MFTRRARALTTAVVVALGLLGSVAAHADDTVTNGMVTSKDGTVIAYSLFQPAAASASSQVPMILHSHGWGGSRSTTVASVKSWLDAGFGVLSFDQRGHGESGGEANVEDPELEGYDVEAIVNLVAGLDWVKHDLDGNGNPIADDPQLGAIGGSYGGGYQTIGALSELLHHGRTRFNALAPEITWYDLPESLAPQGVPRTLWTTLLYAVAPPHAGYIDQAEAAGIATGDFPDGTIPIVPNLKDIFYHHSPRWFADNGYHLDIPVAFGQGITDNLFNLNQGIHNFERVLTAGAQSKSIFVGYNSGHVLPEALPLANNPSGSPCGSFATLSREFYTAVFAGQNPRTALGAKTFNIATDGGGCVRSDSLGATRSVPAGPLGTVAINTAAGAPINLPLGVSGPITLAGIPHLRGALTTTGLSQRAFFALSVGTSPADAKVIQNNVMPVRSLLPAVMAPINAELPGIGIEVPAGQSLFLTVAPTASAFVGNASRTPGVVTITDAVVDLPVIG